MENKVNLINYADEESLKELYEHRIPEEGELLNFGKWEVPKLTPEEKEALKKLADNLETE